MKDALQIALQFIKFRPRSVFEVRQRLGRSKVPDDEIVRVIARLKKAQILDDQQFAKIWVSHRQSVRPASARVLKMELKKLGLEGEIIEAALAADNVKDDLVQAREAIEPKWKLYQNLPASERWRKAAGFLSRRGFNYGIIKAVLEE